MSNFLRIAAGMDTFGLLHAIMRQPALWGMFGAAQDEIVLRDYMEGTQVLANYPPFDMLPQAHGMIFGAMARVQGEELGRVKVKRLLLGERKGWSDQTRFECYYMIIAAAPGAMIIKGDERASAESGTAWWIAGGEDIFQNDGQDDLLVLAVEVKPYGPCEYLPEAAV